MSATMERAADAAECRRLAEALTLDAVGIARVVGGRRRIAWWTAPGSPVLPLDIDAAVDGRADGWLSCRRGADVVFGRPRPGSPVRTAQDMAAMLEPGSTVERTVEPAEHGGVAPEDPLERERTRWAYAIHDGLTQVVTAAILDLEWQARRAESEPAEARAALVETATELRSALAEIRRILAIVSPEEPDGGTEPLEELLEGVVSRWQLPASWTIDGDLERVPRRVLEAASAVIRESVANAAKHADASGVAVEVHATARGMEVTVEDSGRGFRASTTGLHAGHLGLEMMRRRVAEVHGTLEIDSSPGRGTRVIARLPVGEGDTP